MICYTFSNVDPVSLGITFQTKLTYGMICYFMDLLQFVTGITFQTKLTYGMICYVKRLP